jgi:catechol-2,3-dioxygenase
MALRLSHSVVYAHDLDLMLDFYGRVLGFTVSDRGPLGGPGSPDVVFMSQVPDEHHQIAFAPVRLETGPSNTVNHLAFRVESLAELRALKARLDEDGRAQNVRPITHGNAWSVYFEDPEGNGVEIFLDTPWHVRQPQFLPLDLSMSDAEIAAWTEQTFASEPDFGPLRDYQAGRARQLTKGR